MDQRQRRAAMFAIYRKIGIEREDGLSVVDFRHSHDAGVGNRHWPITIFLMQLAQCRDVLLDAEAESERALLQQPEKAILPCGKTGEQMHCFREHRLANEQWSREFLDALGNPAMMSFRRSKNATSGPASTMAVCISA